MAQRHHDAGSQGDAEHDGEEKVFCWHQSR
jgi:hypothetical protein